MPHASKKILLLSPYDILSHQYWWQGLQTELPQHQWQILSLPPRYFSWRIRGNSLSWAFSQRDVLEQDYDLLIACSMTDLSSLRGFVPHLSKIPTLVYCHENQFFFPQSENQKHNAVEAQILQIYTLLCADKVLFNSQFNRNTFLQGAKALLKKLPDAVPGQIIERIEHNSSVLPVLLKDCTVNKKQNARFTLTWNHRWEYDKGLEQLHCLIQKIIHNKLPCKINLLGQQFRNIPDAMQTAIALLKVNQLDGHIGFVENKQDYYNLLAASDVVLSTSLHEFQGLSIMEAVQCGCIPLLPNRLSYPEFFPPDSLYHSDANNMETESAAAFEKLLFFYQQWQAGKLLPDEKQIASLPSWQHNKTDYQQLIDSL